MMTSNWFYCVLGRGVIGCAVVDLFVVAMIILAVNLAIYVLCAGGG